MHYRGVCIKRGLFIVEYSGVNDVFFDRRIEMRKLLVALILFSLAGTAAASSFGSLVTFAPIDEGNPGSLSNPLHVGDFVDVYITVNELFFSMNVAVLVNGPAEIVDATGKDEAEQFGWNYSPSYEPIVTSDVAEVGLAVEFDPKPTGYAAMITLQAMAPGEVYLELVPGMSFEPSTDGYFRDPVVEGFLTIYQATPEPATVSILGLGFLLIGARKKRI